MASPAAAPPEAAAEDAAEHLMQQLFGQPAQSATFEFALLALGVAFGLGFVVSLAYRFTSRELVHSQKLMQSLVIVAGTICTIMTVVRDHLAVAFALVGVLSVLRLRAVVGNSREFIFILVSLSAGLGAGSADNYTHLAITSFGVVAVSLVAWVLYRTNFGRHAGVTFNVTIKAPAESQGPIRSVLDARCQKVRPAGFSRFGDPRGSFLFEVLMAPNRDPVELIAALQTECQATEVTLLPWQREGAVGDRT